MAAIAQNVTMVAGDTAELSFSVYEEDGLTAQDLSGASIAWQMRRAGSSTALVSKTTGDGITVTDAEAGKLTVSLDPEDTEDLAAGRYAHGAVVTDSDDNVSTISLGFMVLLPAVITVIPEE